MRIAIVNDMLLAVEALRRDVMEPAGLHMELTAEDAGYVEASVRNVWTNLGLGAVFATLVMYLFLRSGAATAVRVIVIPLCTIAGCLGLYPFERTSNVISLAVVAVAEARAGVRQLQHERLPLHARRDAQRAAVFAGRDGVLDGVFDQRLQDQARHQCVLRLRFDRFRIRPTGQGRPQIESR